MGQDIIRIARAVAWKYYRGHHEFDDLVGEGILSIWQYRDRYDPKRAGCHSTYYWRTARRGMSNYLNRNRSTRLNRRVPCHWEGVDTPERSSNEPDKIAECINRVSRIRNIGLSILPIRTYQIMMFRYWKGMSPREIAPKFGISIQRTSKIYLEAMGKMREACHEQETN